MAFQNGKGRDVRVTLRANPSLSWKRGKQIEVQRFAPVPVGGYLQDGRAAHAAMREKHGLLEFHSVMIDGHWKRDAAQFVEMVVFIGEGEGNEAGARLHDAQAELFRDAVTKITRAELGK